MIEGCDRRDAWVGVPELKLIASEPWVGMAMLQIERNGALFGVHGLIRS
jgi:hypothetical protein